MKSGDCCQLPAAHCPLRRNDERRTMCCSPFVTQSLAADDCSSGSSRAGRVGQSVLRLVRKEFHRPAWQVRNSSCPESSRLIGPHERTIPRPEEELGIDQRAEQRVARGAIETPEPLRLRRRQPQSGHLDVLALTRRSTSSSGCCAGMWLPRSPIRVMDMAELSNGRATRRARPPSRCISRNP